MHILAGPQQLLGVMSRAMPDASVIRPVASLMVRAKGTHPVSDLPLRVVELQGSDQPFLGK